MINLSSQSMIAGSIHAGTAALAVNYFTGGGLLNMQTLTIAAIIMAVSLAVDTFWPRHPGLD